MMHQLIDGAAQRHRPGGWGGSHPGKIVDFAETASITAAAREQAPCGGYIYRLYTDYIPTIYLKYAEHIPKIYRLYTGYILYTSQIYLENIPDISRICSLKGS